MSVDEATLNRLEKRKTRASLTQQIRAQRSTTHWCLTIQVFSESYDELDWTVVFWHSARLTQYLQHVGYKSHIIISAPVCSVCILQNCSQHIIGYISYHSKSQVTSCHKKLTRNKACRGKSTGMNEPASIQDRSRILNLVSCHVLKRNFQKPYFWSLT